MKNEPYLSLGWLITTVYLNIFDFFQEIRCKLRMLKVKKRIIKLSGWIFIILGSLFFCFGIVFAYTRNLNTVFSVTDYFFLSGLFLGTGVLFLILTSEN
jgi:vacuolar-type H+-ATPase subunit I/STV1